MSFVFPPSFPHSTKKPSSISVHVFCYFIRSTSAIRFTLSCLRCSWSMSDLWSAQLAISSHLDWMIWIQCLMTLTASGWHLSKISLAKSRVKSLSFSFSFNSSMNFSWSAIWRATWAKTKHNSQSNCNPTNNINQGTNSICSTTFLQILSVLFLSQILANFC